MTTTSLDLYCQTHNRERWECLARVLRGFRQPDGSRRWKVSAMADELFDGSSPDFPNKSLHELKAALADFPRFDRETYTEVVRVLASRNL